MDYPRRFYKKKAGKEGRSLKYPKEIIKQCRLCGTYYLDYAKEKKWCSTRCKNYFEQVGDITLFGKN